MRPLVKWVMRFEWAEAHVEHLERHGIRPHIANDVAAVGECVVLGSPNSPAGRKMLIGYTSRGRMVTLILTRTDAEGVWRPVTGWWSTPREIERYRAARARRDRHG